MKSVVSFLLSVGLLLATAPATFAQPRQVLQGTQVHLSLLTAISTAAARDGDPILASVAEPVYLGGQLLIPAGARVRGVVGTVTKARRFSMFHQGAYINLSFQSLEMDSRLIPIQMSIISIEQSGGKSEGKERKDVKVEEGQVVQAKYDVKRDLLAGAVGTGGGTVVGAVLGNLAGGFGIGMAGSAVYVMSRKGKGVELPAQTGMLVRMDSTITVPQVVASNIDPAAAR